MTSPTDNATESSTATGAPSAIEPLRDRSRSRLNQALAWVGIVAGGLFIVAGIFFSGFFLSWGLGGHWDEHTGSEMMACCSHMKPGEQMGHGTMMGPGGMMGPSPQPPTPAPPSTPRP